MGARTKRLERLAANPKPPPRKYTQAQEVSRDGPPFGGLVASVVIPRFSPQWTLEIIGVEDYDPRKSKKRLINGIHSPFCLCLPGGRQQTNMKSGEKEAPHFVARKEAQEEAGISLPFNELLPILAARRVGWGETSRDSFDKERSPDDGQVIHFDHFIFACYGEDIVPGTPREKNIKNPAWHPIETILGNELWSFDHVTFIIATLKVIGDISRRWSRGEWSPEAPRGDGTREEALGSLFFERLAETLKRSPEALSALERFAPRPDDLRKDFHEIMRDAVAERETGSREEQVEQAEWYLGIKHERVAQELEAKIAAFQSGVDRARGYLIRAEQRANMPSHTPQESEKEAKIVETARRILDEKEKGLQRAKNALLHSHGRFVHGSFQPLGSASKYQEVLREIEKEQEARR